MFVYLNGKYIQEAKAVINVNDHGFLYGDGVYETLRTYGGKIWKLDEHLKRLHKSAELMMIDFSMSGLFLERCIKRLIKMNKLKEVRIRVTVTRGENGMNFSMCGKPTVYVRVSDLGKPWPKTGVDTVTINQRRILPQVKTISLLPFILGQQKASAGKVAEAIFIGDDRYVREGTVTNIFMVKKGIVITPKSGILDGVTRGALVAVARRHGIKVLVKDFKVERLYAADEAFLTNAPRGIVPIKSVDGKKIGSVSAKTPGKMTKIIMRLWDDFVGSK